MTGDEFRELVLSMDGAVEGAHMKHPDFRANGRIFASLQPGEESGIVKLSPDEQYELIRLHPKMFVPAAGAWGGKDGRRCGSRRRKRPRSAPPSCSLINPSSRSHRRADGPVNAADDEASAPVSAMSRPGFFPAT